MSWLHAAFDLRGHSMLINRRPRPITAPAARHAVTPADVSNACHWPDSIYDSATPPALWSCWGFRILSAVHPQRDRAGRLNLLSNNNVRCLKNWALYETANQGSCGPIVKTSSENFLIFSKVLSKFVLSCS